MHPGGIKEGTIPRDRPFRFQGVNDMDAILMDRNFLGLRFFGLWNVNIQNTVSVFGFDLFRIQAFRQHEGAAEFAVDSFLTAVAVLFYFILMGALLRANRG